MRIVVALGGNALLRRGEPPEAHLQLEHVAEAARPLILTDVAGVAEGWGTPDQRFIDRISTAEARNLDLPSGSMGPKVDACIAFVEAAGARAAIGSIEDPAAVVEGH